MMLDAQCKCIVNNQLAGTDSAPLVLQVANGVPYVLQRIHRVRV